MVRLRVVEQLLWLMAMAAANIAIVCVSSDEQYPLASDNHFVDAVEVLGRMILDDDFTAHIPLTVACCYRAERAAAQKRW